MLNRVTMMGRLVANPELKTTPSGTSVTSFAVAVDRNQKAKDGSRQADFFDIVAWSKTAELVCKYMTKGSMIVIDGRLQARSYTDKNGNKRKAVEVVAENISFAGDKKPAGQSDEYDYQSETRTATVAPAEAAPAGIDDFALIDDSDDLPF